MKRPTSITVFGILNIVFGILGVFGLLITFASGMATSEEAFPFMDQNPVMEIWFNASNALGAVFTVVLIASGVGLLYMRPWARTASIVYAVYAILGSLVGVALTVTYVFLPMRYEMEGGEVIMWSAIVAGVVGAVVSCIYPALLWYYMTRPRNIAALEGAALSDELPPDLLATPASANPYAAPLTSSPLVVEDEEPTFVDSTMETLIPSKNAAALWSYYLGLFSLFPLFGIFLAVPAVFLGVRGLKNARANPAVRGKVHAWIGLICGSLFGLMNIGLIGLVILGITQVL